MIGESKVANRTLPPRVRVVVIGGGIHGVGMLHDIATRGWKDCLLLEKNTIGSGTSSKSSKLIHGGLRYLQRIQDYPLVAEGLRERAHLIRLAPDIVKPLRMVLPIRKGAYFAKWKYKIGLTLYDFLSGKLRLANHQALTHEQLLSECPQLNPDGFSSGFVYWDGQTDDDSLVRRVAASAIGLGGQIHEGVKVKKIQKDEDGFLVSGQDELGKAFQVSCRYVINCAGPWVEEIVLEHELTPAMRGLNNKGSHLLIPDKGFRTGLFLESPADKRIFFVLPWQGYTLVGTTELEFKSSPDEVRASEEEVDYMIGLYNKYFLEKINRQDVLRTFSGLRWLAKDSSQGLSATSRSIEVEEAMTEKGLLLTLYGGKLTSYRRACEKIVDKVFQHFGEFERSRTLLAESWAGEGEYFGGYREVLDRFDP